MSDETLEGLLELHELRVFLVAAETENFSETGRILNMSQPAVSGHIQSLEQKLSTRLFDRTGRHIRLNEAGEAFVPVVRNLLKKAREAEEFIASRTGTLIGQVTVGCSTSSGKYILPRLMARFLEANPNVQMVCEVGPRGQALDRLGAGEIDLAVSSLRVPRRDIEYEHFSDDLLILIVPPDHPWAAAGCIQPTDLVDHEIICREAGSGTAYTLSREFAKHEISLDMLPSRLTLGNTEAIVQAVSLGLGPGFVSSIAAAAALRHEAVVEVKVESVHLVQPLYMARHTSFHATEAQKAFWDFAFAPQNKPLRQFFT